LLTHDDLSDRRRYLNARSTLRALVGFGVVPVVNENDAVANEELKFGDNDTLAALVANLIEADLLVLLTDQQGLYDADPRANPDATLVSHAEAGDGQLDAMAGDGGMLGRGGMQTKLRAARLAARSGTVTAIAYGRESDVLARLRDGDPVGTLLTASQQPDAARKRWLAGHLQVRGRLTLDAGASRVLRESGRSLLAVGVKKVDGEFRRGEMVACVDELGVEFARGLVNYSAHEARLIMGRPSGEIEHLLGYVDDEELIHRDNLVLI
jgi:glutamate 5-kinase